MLEFGNQVETSLPTPIADTTNRDNCAISQPQVTSSLQSLTDVGPNLSGNDAKQTEASETVVETGNPEANKTVVETRDTASQIFQKKYPQLSSDYFDWIFNDDVQICASCLQIRKSGDGYVAGHTYHGCPNGQPTNAQKEFLKAVRKDAKKILKRCEDEDALPNKKKQKRD